MTLPFGRPGRMRLVSVGSWSRTCRVSRMILESRQIDLRRNFRNESHRDVGLWGRYATLAAVVLGLSCRFGSCTSDVALLMLLGLPGWLQTTAANVAGRWLRTAAANAPLAADRPVCGVAQSHPVSASMLRPQPLTRRQSRRLAVLQHTTAQKPSARARLLGAAKHARTAVCPCGGRLNSALAFWTSQVDLRPENRASHPKQESI